MALLDNWRTKLPRWLGYSGFFLACFGVSLYLNVPASILRSKIIDLLTKNAPGYAFDMDDVSPSGVGVSMENFRIRKSSFSEEERSDMVFDELTVRASLFAYLMGKTKVAFDGEMEDGTIEGSFTESKEQTDIELDIDDVSLKRVAPLKGMIGLPADGTVNGSVDLSVAEKKEETTGHVELTIDNLTVGDGRSKLKIGPMAGGITVDAIHAGKLEAEIDVDKGIAEIKKFEAKGSDLEMNISGDARVERPVGRTRVNLLATIRFLDAYKKKSDRTKGMFALIESLPQLASARTKDGGLQYRLAGSLSGQIIPRPAGHERTRRSKATPTKVKAAK